MASSNQYAPQTVALDGGLDLISPRITAAPGSLAACFNFERTDHVGYSRIYGHGSYDGDCFPHLCYTNLAVVEYDPTYLEPGSMVMREPLYVDGGAGPGGSNLTLGYVMGVDSSTSHHYLILAITNYEEWNRLKASYNAITPYKYIYNPRYPLQPTKILSYEDFLVKTNPTTLVDASFILHNRNELFKAVRNLVTIPGADQVPTIGLHWWNDRLYAVKDLQVVPFTLGNTQIYANDQLYLTGSANHPVQVLDVRLNSGEWAEGNAAGVFLVDAHAYAVPDTIPPGSYEVHYPGPAPISIINDVVLLGAVSQTGVWGAGLFVATSHDQSVSLPSNPPKQWSKVDLGYSFKYGEGTHYGPPQISRRGKFSDYSTAVLENSQAATDSSITQPSHGDPPSPILYDDIIVIGEDSAHAVLATLDDTKYVWRRCNNSDAYTGPYTNYYSGRVNLSGYKAYNAATNVTITGLKIKARARAYPIPYTNTYEGYTHASTHGSVNIALWTGSGSFKIQVNTGNMMTNDGSSTSDGPWKDFEWGGADELFDLSAADVKALLNESFKVAIEPKVGNGGPNTRNGAVEISFFELIPYFTIDISKYYFHNTVLNDDVSADITAASVATGDWSTDDATGILQVVNVEAVGASARRTILAGDELWTEANRQGIRILTVKNDMAYNGLDTREEIELAKSRYQIVTANFYGDKQYIAMYGVTGAGRGWTYDGFYFNRLIAIADKNLDKPRHIAFHQFHLALGYDSGAVLLSALGNPQEYSGVLGAVEIDVGDACTGLVRMDGTTLGIFCRSSIHGLVGTSADNFSTSVLSPYEGAIEYTVIDVGRPVYCSYRGISLFEQTAAYGDFSGQRLSFAVNPWLLPRLQGKTPPIGVAAATKGVVCAVANRTNNQYNLYFKDGYCLSMALTGTERQPMFTISAQGLYDKTDGSYISNLVPRAESSQVDQNGQERVHLAHYSRTNEIAMKSYPILEMGKAWTFNGAPIPAYLVGVSNFYNSMFDIDIIRKARLHGMSFGIAPLKLTVEGDYNANMSVVPGKGKVVDISLPRVVAPRLHYELTPVTNIADLGTRGRSFNFRFMSYDVAAEQSTLTNDPTVATLSPPFIIQGLLIQTLDGKGDI